MADETTTAPSFDKTGPATTTDAPNVPDDSQQWADLAKELEAPEPRAGDHTPEPPPPTEPEPEPEAKAEPDKPPPSYEQLRDLERNKTAALKEEREARRRAEESLGNVNKLIDELRTARAQRAPEQPRPEPKPLPDVNEDPIGHFQAKVAQLENYIAQTYQGSRQTAEQIQAREQEQQFWSHVQSAEADFRKTAPTVQIEGKAVSDYDLACEHLKTHRVAELANLYPDDSPVAQQEARQYGLPTVGHLRAAMLQQDAIAIAQRAFQLGISPAQLYYEAAKGRGYKAPAAGANGKSKANGQIEAQKRGVKASLSISGGEGRKSNNDMTMADLSDLWKEDPEEFDKEWERMKRAGKLG